LIVNAPLVEITSPPFLQTSLKRVTSSTGASWYHHQHTRLGEKERSVYAAAWGDAHATAAWRLRSGGGIKTRPYCGRWSLNAGNRFL